MLSLLAAGASTIWELVSGAVEPALARPVLMYLLWIGEAMVDMTAPITAASRV